MLEHKEFQETHMDMSVKISLPTGTNETSVKNAFQVFKNFDSKFSRFIPSSELSYVNKHTNTWVNISDDFLEIMRLSSEAFEMTEEYFDITIGTYLNAYGYDEKYQIRNPKEKIKYLAMKGISFSNVKTDFDKKQIFIPDEITLDPAAIVKVYAIKKAAEQLESLDTFMINAGGDILMKGKWTIGIQSPNDKNNILGKITLKDTSICTSGTYIRSTNLDGFNWNHLINPFTGIPARTKSVSVIDKDIIRANIFSTALICMEKEKIDLFLKGKNIEYLFVDKNNKTYGTKFFSEHLS